MHNQTQHNTIYLFTMVLKIAAEESPVEYGDLDRIVTVREYDEARDLAAADELERRCEIGGGRRGKPALVTDLMGDPMCRIRQFRTHVMLVAEYGESKEIVGLIRGCVKSVTQGNSVYVKLAYILGLRVSPKHRRLGIGTKLVSQVEQWCKQNGAEYAYMATDCTNEPSINLFTKKRHYVIFRRPTMLVQPIHAHRKPISSSIAIVPIPRSLAEPMYRRIFANSEFFPKDIDAIIASRLNLGTFMAVPRRCLGRWDPSGTKLPESFAVLSVWNTKEVFKLQVKGVSGVTYACCAASRAVDALVPWLRLPSFPDVFRRFGVYFLYGLHMEGRHGVRLLRALCTFAYNMARDAGDCGAVVAEVGLEDPARAAIPHWRRFSLAEDLWCIKRLADTEPDRPDWVNVSRSTPPPVIFVDPRDN